MSADNFYLVRRAGSRYGVTNESASASIELADPTPLTSALAAFYTPTPIDSPLVHWFDDEASALAFARDGYSEYGIEVTTNTDSADDTQANRLTTLLHAIAAIIPTGDILLTHDAEHNVVTLLTGPYEIKVEGPSFEDAAALASVIEAVLFPYFE